MSDFPLYPELSEAGQTEAQELVNKFKAEIVKAAEDAIGDLYCDVAVHIESSSWTNYRNKMMDGFRNYGNRNVQGEHDFKIIRKAIYDEFRDELIVDLNQDMLKEIEGLKEQLEWQIRANRH